MVPPSQELPVLSASAMDVQDAAICQQGEPPSLERVLGVSGEGAAAAAEAVREGWHQALKRCIDNPKPPSFQRNFFCTAVATSAAMLLPLAACRAPSSMQSSSSSESLAGPSTPAAGSCCSDPAVYLERPCSAGKRFAYLTLLTR